MKTASKRLLGALIGLCAACSVAGPNPTSPPKGPDTATTTDASSADPGHDDAADAAAMDALLRRYAEQNQFMGAVLVVRKGVVLIDRAYGYANAEWEVPNTRETKFRIGSMSKQFTAAAILLLEEEGKLRVEDLLSRHVPEVPAAWAPISLHHLLSHSAGLPDIVMFPDYPTLRTQPFPPEKVFALLREKPLDFVPGAKFQYSNSGYVMLALVIERLTGKSFDDFLRTRVLAPHGLKDTGSDAVRPLNKRRAAGYVPLTVENGVAPPTPYRNCDFIDMSLPTGGGGLYSTTGDLLRWQEALFGGRVLSPATLAKMTSVQLGNYGYGLFVGDFRGLRRIGHGGSIHGFLSSQNHYPEAGITQIILANLTAGKELGEISAGITDLVLGTASVDAGAD